jgi:hypothetical protein
MCNTSKLSIKNNTFRIIVEIILKNFFQVFDFYLPLE